MDLAVAKEFLGESEAEAVKKAAKFFGVAEAQLELRTLPGNLGLSGLGSRVVVLASLKEGSGGDRVEGRDRGERGERGERGHRGHRRERGDRGDRRERRDRGGGGERPDIDHAELEKLAHESVAEVTKTGEPILLRPMSSKERWVAHNVVNETQGVRSESTGEGRLRRVRIERE